jgi:hypothetical protein
MGSHHLLRDKIRLGFTKPGEVMFLERSELSKRGPVFADVWARAIPLGPTVGRLGLHGLQIALSDGDKSPSCTIAQDWRCDRGGYNHYTLEVVDRIGYDSFTPDNGVIIAKTKNADTAPFVWVIDSHPEDINAVDFVRPDGSEAMISKGDYRQLADAAFHAGNGPGVVSEYVDKANRLHFYILGSQRDADGVLSYRVAVRATDGAQPLVGDLTSLVRVNETRAAPGRVARYDFRLSNTLSRAEVVRLTATIDNGWEVFVPHDFVEVRPGEAVTIPVYVRIPEGAEGSTGVLRLKAASETSHQKRTTAIPVIPAS